MTRRLALILAATVLAPASALAQEQAAAPNDAAADPAPPPEMKALVESCAARKFETVVNVTVDGEERGKKVTLCGKQGQSDADWMGTLRDAAKKVESDEKMAPAVKEQIITALNMEIAKLQPAGGAIEIGLPLAVVSHAEREPEYSKLPPLPSAPKVAAYSSSAAPAMALKKPRLTIRCLAPGEKGGGSTCAFLEPDTRLAIRADEDMESGAILRFLRRGDARGEVALAQLRQGQSFRTKLPSDLCTGVAKAKIEIQVVGGRSQVLDTLGPYGLRC